MFLILSNNVNKNVLWYNQSQDDKNIKYNDKRSHKKYYDEKLNYEDKIVEWLIILMIKNNKCKKALYYFSKENRNLFSMPCEIGGQVSFARCLDVYCHSHTL